LGVSRQGEFKNTIKIFWQKVRVEKLLQKIRPQSKTDFFSIFFYHVFGRFLVRGVQKYDKKYRKK
jgi:hypothetical protein